MPIDSQQLSAANPLAIANASYINALYRKKFGRGATRQELAKFAGRSVKDSANLVLGSSSPFTGQTTPTTTTSPDAGASESDQLQALIERLTPKPVDRGELTSRFSSLFDPTYQANEGEINRTLDQSSSRFGEDAAIAERRRTQSRALALGQTQEQLAAGGASGQLADQFTARQLTPYDQGAEDATLASTRFTADTAEERRRRLLQNKQSRSAALAGYTSDPNNLYEFSF